jgi:hypothetical protein
MKKRKYIYLTGKSYDETVFITQVVDWLRLYQSRGIEFSFYKTFHIKEYAKRGRVKLQIEKIKNVLDLAGHTLFFPSKGFFAFVNSVLLYLSFRKYFGQYDEVLVFSRDIFGKEIDWLKKFTSTKLLFYFDARAASAEENRYSSIKMGNFSYKQFEMIAHIHYTEYRTVCCADKIFTVSNILKDYYIKTYNASNKKYVLYPCLSDSNKFYYDKNLRDKTRCELGYNSNEKVFLYSGGISSQWHQTDSLFKFYNIINNSIVNSRFLFLTKDVFSLEDVLCQYPTLKSNLKYMSVDNSQMINYLNAADYSILFRENAIMNNVASPTKFAENMLCGLPTLISEGVGDYTQFCVNHNTGYVVTEQMLKNIENFDVTQLLTIIFDREHIARIGKEQFSKQSVIDNMVREFQED